MRSTPGFVTFLTFETINPEQRGKLKREGGSMDFIMKSNAMTYNETTCKEHGCSIARDR